MQPRSTVEYQVACIAGHGLSLLKAYVSDVADGNLKFEAGQEACVGTLETLLSNLDLQKQQVQTYNSLLRTYLDRRKAAVRKLNEEDQQRARRRHESCKQSDIPFNA